MSAIRLEDLEEFYSSTVDDIFHFLGDYYYWTMSGGENDPTIVINRALIENYKISVSWKGVNIFLK